ncbi:MAG: hypothetical protein RL077_358 [Verrucomicrobiota bacterium]|jgi:hypothetical protein
MLLAPVTVTSSITEILPPRRGRLGYVVTVKGGGTVAFGYGDNAATQLSFANGNEIPVGGDRFVIADEIARLGVYGITSAGSATVAVQEF